MTPPRKLYGEELARQVFRRFGYRLLRQKGNHVTLSADTQGGEHRLTIPSGRRKSVGTIIAIISEFSGDLVLNRDRDHRSSGIASKGKNKPKSAINDAIATQLVL